MAFWSLVSADDFLESLRILFIIAVTGHRCKPVVLHLRSFKRGVRELSLLRVGTVVEWNELRCIQLAHPYSTLWGKENWIEFIFTAPQCVQFSSRRFCVHGYFEQFQEAGPLETRKL